MTFFLFFFLRFKYFVDAIVRYRKISKSWMVKNKLYLVGSWSSTNWTLIEPRTIENRQRKRLGKERIIENKERPFLGGPWEQGVLMKQEYKPKDEPWFLVCLIVRLALFDYLFVVFFAGFVVAVLLIFCLAFFFFICFSFGLMYYLRIIAKLCHSIFQRQIAL